MMSPSQLLLRYVVLYSRDFVNSKTMRHQIEYALKIVKHKSSEKSHDIECLRTKLSWKKMHYWVWKEFRVRYFCSIWAMGAKRHPWKQNRSFVNQKQTFQQIAGTYQQPVCASEIRVHSFKQQGSEEYKTRLTILCRVKFSGNHKIHHATISKYNFV